jgi:hypothetical protein
MTARDELAQLICDACEDYASEVPYDTRTADVLLAAGWRKMPSRDAILSAIDSSPWDEDQADAVLALMDGDNEC